MRPASIHGPRPARRMAPALAALMAVSALAALVAVPALALPAHARVAAGRGDWEATGTGGAQASFAIGVARRRFHGRERRFVAVSDLVVNAPIRCANAPSAPPAYDLEALSGALALSRHGTFSAGRLKRGAGTVVEGRLQGGVVHLTYRHISKARNKFDGGIERCATGAIRLTARPGARRALEDGVWIGLSQNNEPIELHVVAGGRALVTSVVHGSKAYAFQIQPESSLDDCPGQVSSGAADSGGYEAGGGPGASFEVVAGLFIQPDGTFDNDQYRFGDSQEVTGTFVSRNRAVGDFQNPGQGCNWTWSASPR
jgi:hypothetical protein